MRKLKQHLQRQVNLNNKRKTNIRMMSSLLMGTQKKRKLMIKRSFKNKLMIRKKKLKMMKFKNKMTKKMFQKIKSKIIKILLLIKLILKLKRRNQMFWINQLKKYLNYKIKLEKSLDHLCNTCRSFKKDLKGINYTQLIRQWSNLKKVKIKKNILKFLL